MTSTGAASRALKEKLKSHHVFHFYIPSLAEPCHSPLDMVDGLEGLRQSLFGHCRRTQCIKLGRRIHFLFQAEPHTPDPIPHTPQIGEPQYGDGRENGEVLSASQGCHGGTGRLRARRQGGRLLSRYHAHTLEFTLYIPRTVRSLRPVGRMHYLSAKVTDTKPSSRLFDSSPSTVTSCI